MRSLRYQAVALIRIVVEVLAAHFTSFMNRRESRKAFELVGEVELYLPFLAERMLDVHGQAREAAQAALKGVMLAMESDLAKEDTF